MANKPKDYQPGEKYPIVKASFDLEANRQNYQKLLADLTAIVVTPDNVNEDLTKDGRDICKSLTKKKDEMSVKPLQEHADIMKVYRDLHDPIDKEVKRVNGDKKIVADKINAERAAQVAEQTRISNCRMAIVNFTNKIANDIRNAATDTDIVTVEKLIGLEKTKKNVYQEFLPDLVTQLDNLRPQIREQKENVRKLQEIAEKEKKAIETGDIIAATQLKEEKEYIETVIEHTGIKIHEKAYEEAIKIDVVVPEVVDIAPKGRSNWKWRVDDIKLLQKKMPHPVKLVPDDEAIDLLLKTKRQDGSLDSVEEENWNGIVFYNDRKMIK